jgi:hypothetical protein
MLEVAEEPMSPDIDWVTSALHFWRCSNRSIPFLPLRHEIGNFHLKNNCKKFGEKGGILSAFVEQKYVQAAGDPRRQRYCEHSPGPSKLGALSKESSCSGMLPGFRFDICYVYSSTTLY